MKTYTIDCKQDIWDTEYVCRVYRDKIVVTQPYTKWRDNTRSLDFKKYSYALDSSRAKDIMEFFEKDEWCNDYGQILDDLLY